MDKNSRNGGSTGTCHVRWPDLVCPAPPPDRTDITLSGEAWRHIFTKHIAAGREPWGELLPAETFAALAAADPAEGFQNATVAAAVGVLEWQVRESLARPLALLYEVRRAGMTGGHPRRRWCLVLPAGATAYVAARGGNHNFLVTCYFPKASVVETHRERRWRRVVRRLVLRYGTWDVQLGAIRLPDEKTVRHYSAQRPTGELHSAIRFVNPTTWGFCPELAGVPWRGRLAPWPAAEPSEPPSRPPPRRHRIKPRRR